MTNKELDNLFSYHPPKGNQVERYNDIREAGRLFAQVVVDSTPAGPDQSAAIRKIREAVMTANAAIACEEGGE
jgi:hypothetical protein